MICTHLYSHIRILRKLYNVVFRCIFYNIKSIKIHFVAIDRENLGKAMEFLNQTSVARNICKLLDMFYKS